MNGAKRISTSGAIRPTEDDAARRPAWSDGMILILIRVLSRTLLLTLMKEAQLFEIDGAVAGATAAGPAAQDGLQEQHRLRQR
jgi:hypothetical protein